MKSKAIISLLSAAMLFGTTQADAKSFKRGVGENNFSIEGQMKPLEPGVSWYYNWGQTPSKGYQNQVINFTGMEYVSMCWNGVNAEALRTYCQEHPGLKYLLGYNEPNFTNQANMTPAKAAEKWPEVVAIAKEFGLKLVAPALNYSPNPPYTDPVKWMDEFVALVGPDAFDFTAIHCYGGLGVMKDLAGKFHDKYGKPVWVTEFCYWPGGAGDVYVSPATQMASMIESVKWLEQTEWIYRYAWFKPWGPYDEPGKPNYALEYSSSGMGDKELTPLGWAYVYMSEFNADKYFAENEIVPATDFMDCHGIMINKGQNPANPLPIEISQFNAGAYADYQFEVAKAGDYTLTVTAGGFGEPSRFNPQLAVYTVTPEGNKGTELAKTESFELPNSNSEYTGVSINLKLEAGRQTLRIEDANPYQPSGITLSTLKLTGGSGVATIEAEGSERADVYSISGMLVMKGATATEARLQLKPGLYIHGKQKLLIK